MAPRWRRAGQRPKGSRAWTGKVATLSHKRGALARRSSGVPGRQTRL